MNDCENLRDFLERFATDRDALHRALPPDFSPARIERLTRFYDEWQSALDALDFETLPRDAQAEAALFANLLERERDTLQQAERRQKETAPLLPFASAILERDAELRRLERPDPAQAAEQLEAIHTELAERMKALSAGSVIGAVTAERAARTTEAMRETLDTWFRFHDGYDPLFSWWVREPFQAADQTLEKYAVALRETFSAPKPAPQEDAAGDSEKETRDEDEDEAAHIVGDPIGPEALRAALERELIPYTPDELIALADREFDWCERELRRAANEMGFGDDGRAALEAVKARHVTPGEQPGLVRDLAREAIAFLDARDLVTIPPLCREIWRMEMMSPEMQKVNPFFLGGETIIVSFPTDGMTQAQKRMSLRGNNRHFSRATVQHELIPGHHLQLFMAERFRPHRRLFTTPFYIEGWAIHWEFLLWEIGFAASPEDRIGMLFWRMHRCARVAFSLRYHLGQMTASECVEMLVNRVGHERENALAEVRRSLGDDYPPLYQAAYLLGGLQMRALYRECVGSGRMTAREFHDAVLTRNAVPIAVLRAELTGQPIPRRLADLQWRFYDYEGAASVPND